jgi:hypothetical protein
MASAIRQRWESGGRGRRKDALQDKLLKIERILLRLNSIVQRTPLFSFANTWKTGREEFSILDTQLLIHAGKMMSMELHKLIKKELTFRGEGVD